MATYPPESGLVLTLPDGLHFRFQDLPAYRRLSGCHLKEMDFAWVHEDEDEDKRALYLLEVRSYLQVTETLTGADFIPVKDHPPPERFQVLVDKITDTLLMLVAAWEGAEWGAGLAAQLPPAVRNRMPLKVIVAVELPEPLRVHLQGLRDSLNARMKGRLAVGGASVVALVEYTQLLRIPLFAPYVARAS